MTTTIDRILTELGTPEIIDKLAALPGSDLTSLLLEVMRRRADDVTPRRVLARYVQDRFTTLPTVSHAALRRAVHQHQLHKYVRFLGYMPETTLAVMYRLAGVFVFPSLYEGFGLPPLEAMASGTPVVTSNLSSLPEVTGDAAVLIDPYDPVSIADGISSVLTDETRRRDLRRKGLARAQQFSWEQSVRRVREIYGEAAAG